MFKTILLCLLTLHRHDDPEVTVEVIRKIFSRGLLCKCLLFLQQDTRHSIFTQHMVRPPLPLWRLFPILWLTTHNLCPTCGIFCHRQDGIGNLSHWPLDGCRYYNTNHTSGKMQMGIGPTRMWAVRRLLLENHPHWIPDGGRKFKRNPLDIIWPWQGHVGWISQSKNEEPCWGGGDGLCTLCQQETGWA